jgi:hypothetical protein
VRSNKKSKSGKGKASSAKSALQDAAGDAGDKKESSAAAKPACGSPFRQLPSGPSSRLFWAAMGVGKDSYMFQNYNIFPFDRLNDTERIIVLTEVAEAMSGYNADPDHSVLSESALYAVFALMKARIYTELSDGGQGGHPIEGHDPFHWRRRVLQSFEQVYFTHGSLAGIHVGTPSSVVWRVCVNLLARSLFGECFWAKRDMFRSPNTFERVQKLRDYAVPQV